MPGGHHARDRVGYPGREVPTCGARSGPRPRVWPAADASRRRRVSGTTRQARGERRGRDRAGA